MIVWDIRYPCFDWDSDWFVRIPIIILIDLSGFWLGANETLFALKIVEIEIDLIKVS